MQIAFEDAEATIGTDFSTVGTFIIDELGESGPPLDAVNLEIENTGDTNAFSDLKLQMQDHPDGEWYDYLIASDFATPEHPNIPFVSATAPNTLAAEGKTHLIFKLHGAYAFRVQAKVAANTTTGIVRGYGRGR